MGMMIVGLILNNYRNYDGFDKSVEKYLSNQNLKQSILDIIQQVADYLHTIPLP